MKNTKTEMMTALSLLIAELAPKSEAGDEEAHIEWAMATALHKYLAAGHALTDLDWFKLTTHYTGGQTQMKAA